MSDVNYQEVLEEFNKIAKEGGPQAGIDYLKSLFLDEDGVLTLPPELKELMAASIGVTL